MGLFQRGILSKNLVFNTEQIRDFCFLPNLLPLKCKIMASGDIQENAMAGGTPTRLRGLDANGNSISPTLAEVARAMPVATENSNGLMSINSIRTFTPMINVFINANDYIDIDNVCGLFIMVSIYSSNIPAIYVVSTKGGYLEKLVNIGPNMVSLVDGKLRIENSRDVRVDVQYCYQNIGR